MGFLAKIFGVKPKTPTVEKTVVYLRTHGITPARFMTSKVHYDAWGTPYIYGDAFHDNWMTNTLNEAGGTSSMYLEWKHKSGPPVSFTKKGDPQKSWFPKNPNNDLPL